MDESLTDFQEKKKSFTGPKNTQKPKNKVKKPVKRIKGQKDIRTALKSKKNELVAYSNDFDKVCKQSGIDLDPEQLQLAIALSKSLQKSKENPEEGQSSGSLTSQERTGKIRTTLQEYGFVVPEVKITTARSKRLKKYRKNYKLLVTTEEEKQQVVSDRYSKVLFDNFESSKLNETAEDTLNVSTRLYNLSTHISYEQIKGNQVFYVENLLEKSESTIGSLLRNWAEIPGRPVSPTREAPNLDFAEIHCSQEELNSILSGTLQTAQEIVRNKYSLLKETETLEGTSKIDTEVQDSNKMDTDDVEIIEISFPKAKGTINIDKCATKSNNELIVTQSIRSYSPDIFDDEVSSILESSRHSIDENFKNDYVTVKSKTKDCEEIMDLTKCVVLNSQRLNDQPLSQLSQGTNVTKRRTNDFMDITDCVTGSSQAIREEKEDENVDLTQDSDENKTSAEKNKTVVEKKDVESLDLTQSSESNELPFVQLSGANSMDNTIIMNESYSEINLGTARNEGKDGPSKTKNNSIAASPLFLESPEYNTPEEDKVREPIEILSDNEDGQDLDNSSNIQARALSPIQHINDNCAGVIANSNTELSETLNSTKDNTISPIKDVVRSKTESFFEEFVYQHSDSSKEKSGDVLVEESNNIDMIGKDIKEDIDLTQSSGSSEGSNSKYNEVDNSQIFKTVGVTNVLQECDEMFDVMIRSHASTSKSISYKSDLTDTDKQIKPSTMSEVASSSQNSEVFEISDNELNYSKSGLTDTDKQIKPSTMSEVASSSQNSEVFEISDNELDYSLHKSKLDKDDKRDNFDFGGISIVDDLPDLPSIRKSRTSFRRSLSDSYLPEVDIKSTGHESTVYSPSKSFSSPDKMSCGEPNKELIVKTPKNSEYVIKTDDVTPMRDYNGMSTPEMHVELDKYGLKPFKRKRAIQLLTHLYNQTHPILESCSSDDLPSPSKKFKKSLSPQKICKNFSKSPKKGTSPRKQVKERADDVIDKENDIYDVTSDVPELRDLECAEEDWVFQKREKAKVHSCRVPLHISFHNYVSTRLRLQESILRYEPVNIDVIHKGLVSNGFRYDPKDLLRFMDKKCITVKTADNNSRNNKKHY